MFGQKAKLPIFYTMAFLSMMLSQGCAHKKTMAPEYVTTEFTTPPGTVKIDSNLYVDATEITNLDYREYLNWLAEIYGKTSQRYISALPDTNVIETKLVYGEPMVTHYYFRHPAYNNYPIIGVTYSQAQNYSKWRSDRVFEVLLLKYYVIEPYPEQDSNSAFTINKYFSGNYFNYKPDSSMPFPVYTLPSLDEWKAGMKAAKTINSIGLDKRNRKQLKERHITDSLFIVDAETSSSSSFFLFPENLLDCKNELIYHLQGNVREFSSEENITLGGSWKDPLNVIQTQDTFHFSEPNAYTGFRNVCRWKRWDYN